MKRIGKKIGVSLCVMMLLCVSMVIQVSASGTTLTDGLDFTTATGNVDETSYTWDNKTKTLTIIDELTINTDGVGLLLPADATVIVNEELTIQSNTGNGITGQGDLTMNINADTNITSTDYTGISISGNINLTVADGVEAYIGGNYNGISTTGTATSTSNSSITSNGSLTIEGSHGIYMYNGDIKIGGTGTIDIISSNAIIANNGTVTFAESATLILATNGYIWGANNTAYTLNSTKVNGLLRLGTSASFTSTVSGAYVPTSDVAFGGSGTAFPLLRAQALLLRMGLHWI